MTLGSTVAKVKEAIGYPNGPKVGWDDGQVAHYYVFSYPDHWIRTEANTLPRHPETPPQDWYPPFDSYPIDLLFWGTTFADRDVVELARAREVFQLLKATNLWSMALVCDGGSIYERHYPPTKEGESAAETDEAEAALVAIPANRYHIFVRAEGTLTALGTEIGIALGCHTGMSTVTDNLTKEVTGYVKFISTGTTLSLNERFVAKPPLLKLDSDVSTNCRFEISFADWRGQLYELDEARDTFKRLKRANRWPLLFVENRTRILDRFEPVPR